MRTMYHHPQQSSPGSTTGSAVVAAGMMSASPSTSGVNSTGAPPGSSPSAVSPGSLSGLFNHSLSIRQEIQRFESVHPSIYAIYDLIELVPDPLLAQQIREHVVCIEGERMKA